jgi:hypothetical protein
MSMFVKVLLTGTLVSGVFSTVDSLYSIMPMLIYTNPDLGNYALASLLEYAPFYGESYAAHDLGLQYSQVTSHPEQNRTPVDGTPMFLDFWGLVPTDFWAASASMIIMTAAFMRYTGSASLAAKHVRGYVYLFILCWF